MMKHITEITIDTVKEKSKSLKEILQALWMFEKLSIIEVKPAATSGREIQ